MHQVKLTKARQKIKHFLVKIKFSQLKKDYLMKMKVYITIRFQKRQ